MRESTAEAVTSQLQAGISTEQPDYAGGEMPVLEKFIQLVRKSLPKVISPTVHAIADYATAGVFLVAGLLFWKKASVPRSRLSSAELRRQQ